MMKVYAALLLSLCLSAPLFTMSRPPKEGVVVTGRIKCYGNEPFTWPGITCDDGREYALCGDKEVLSSLLEKQGVHIQIEGTLAAGKDSIRRLKDGAMEVARYSIAD